jgi:hypothetical protein
MLLVSRTTDLVKFLTPYFIVCESTLKLFHVDLKTTFPNAQHVTKLHNNLLLHILEMRSSDILATYKSTHVVLSNICESRMRLR